MMFVKMYCTLQILITMDSIVHSIMTDAFESLAWEQFLLKAYVREKLKGVDKDLRSAELYPKAADVNSYETVESILTLKMKSKNTDHVAMVLRLNIG